MIIIMMQTNDGGNKTVALLFYQHSGIFNWILPNSQITIKTTNNDMALISSVIAAVYTHKKRVEKDLFGYSRFVSFKF